MSSSSQRPSLTHEDPSLRSSVAVRTGAQLVGLLVSHFTKATILSVLHISIPVPDLVGWFSRAHVQFDFRTLFLSISPSLREATSEQIETFNKLALKGVLHALRGVTHLTCPSVVMATLVHHRVIDSSYIESLSPLLEQPFEVVRTAVGGVPVLFSENALARLDMDFHALPRDQVLHNFRQNKTRNTATTSSWGGYIGAAIYKAWLLRLDVHKSELVTHYAQEHHPLAAVPSLASSSSSNSSSSSAALEEVEVAARAAALAKKKRREQEQKGGGPSNSKKMKMVHTKDDDDDDEFTEKENCYDDDTDDERLVKQEREKK